MDRRAFLKASAAVAVSASGPTLLGMTRKADSPHPVIGVEGHMYECHHGWGQLPGDLEWQTTHNIAVDAEGLVYVTHQGHKDRKGLDTVLVFEPSGRFVRSFGKEWHGGGHGIDIRKEGNEEFLYLTNTWTPTVKVAKATRKGELVWQMGRPKATEYENPKAAYNPTNVAFSPDGSFFVGDGYGSHYLLKYDKDGKLLKVFGGRGTEPGQFQTPHGNWVDARNPDNPVLVVCDRANARLQTFDLEGNFLSMTDKGTVLFPAHIDTRGDIMLVPDLHARISLLGRNNQPIVHLGDDEAWRKTVLDGFKVRRDASQWPAGKFIHPHDACFDRDGNIYVAEWVEGGRITFLKKLG
jgi:WD40 repeat protein